MLAIRLPEDIELRLAHVALESGRTKTTLAREAILEYIDDLENFYLAQARSSKNRTAIPIRADKPKIKFGLGKGKASIADDFDAPMPLEIQALFESVRA